MIKFRQKGDFSKAFSFLEKAKEKVKMGDLDRYGQEGVIALSSATPKDTGITAASWRYEIVRTDGKVSIVWKNDNIHEGVPIAILIQYDHGTATGGFVKGRDYINPAMQPIFDKIADSVWREV